MSAQWRRITDLGRPKGGKAAASRRI